MFTLYVGQIFGIPIKLDFSWFLVFLLVTTSIIGQLAVDFPNHSSIFIGVTAVVTALCLFGSVLLHELGHSLVAIQKGIKVDSITLFIFGGVASIASEPKRAKDEFQIAIAGPMMSFFLSFSFTLLHILLSIFPPNPIGTGIYLLAGINFSLGIFNLIPAFPLDGGRIFRAILWHYQKNYAKATLTAAEVGKSIGYLGVAFAVYLALTVNVFSGLWIGFISWYVVQLAKQSQAQVYVEAFKPRLNFEWKTSPTITFPNIPRVVDKTPSNFSELYDPIIIRMPFSQFIIIEQPLHNKDLHPKHLL
jgi:Zn-dependent protease